MLDIAGHRIAVTSPPRSSSPTRGDEARPGAVLPRGCRAVPPRRRWAATSCSASPTVRRASRSSRTRPESAPEWLQTTIVSTPNGTTSRALMLADMAHVIWAVKPRLSRLSRLASPPRPPGRRGRAAPRPRPQPGVGFEEAARAAAARYAGYSTSSGSSAIRRPLGTADCTSTSGSSRAGTLRRSARSGRGRPRAGAPPPRADHLGVVEGGARCPRLRRLQPERAAQDRLRRLVGARPPRAQVSRR